MFLTRHERKVSPSGGSILMTSAPKVGELEREHVARDQARQIDDADPVQGPACVRREDFLAGFLANVLFHELEGAFHRPSGGAGVVRAALVAMEAVVGRIVEHCTSGCSLRTSFTCVIGMCMSLSPKCSMVGTAGFSFLGAEDAAAVIAHRPPFGLERASRPSQVMVPPQQKPVTADLLGARFFSSAIAAFGVLDRLVEAQLAHDFAALRHGVGRVPSSMPGFTLIEISTAPAPDSPGPRTIVGDLPGWCWLTPKIS